MNVIELRAKRAGLVDQARKIIENMDSYDESVRAEKEQEFDRITAEVDNLKSSIDRHERLDALQDQKDLAAAEQAERLGNSPDEQLDNNAAYEAAFSRWAGACETPEDLQLMRAHVMQSGQPAFGIRAAQSTTTGAGGYTIPEGFMADWEVAQLAHGPIRDAVTVFRTATGNHLPWPTVNDTSNKGAILGENLQDGEQDFTDAEITFDAYKYTSKIIRVSIELLQDSAFNLPSFLGETLGTRIARITNQHFTTGTGSSQPNGIATAATLGYTASANDAITYDDLIELEHSVDPAYRARGAFMFHDNVLKALRKLKDNDGRPLWQAGLTVGAPDSLNGRPYSVNQEMPTLAAGAKSVLFGDLKKYKIRDVLGITLTRMVERYADFHQVAWVAISRHDGNLLDAGTNPVKYLQQSSG